MTPKRKCQRCGKVLFKIQKKFCCRICANQTRAEGVQVWAHGICKRCGKKFTYKPYHHGGVEREFCSLTCSNLGRKITIGAIAKLRAEPPVTFICLNCKNPFTILACYTKQSQRKFCSQKCNGAYRVGKPSPHKTPIGKGGSFGKGGYRNDIQMYVRSRWEANYIRYLIHAGHSFQYEPKQFLITLPDGTQHSYTPDLLIDDHHYVEIKGWMREDRRQREVLQAAKSQLDFPLMLITKDGYRNIEKKIAGKIENWEYSNSKY